MRIAIGSDHAGVELRRNLGRALEALGHKISDLGTDAAGSVDYPDVAAPVADAVGRGDADRGILICGTGMGMQIAANKVRGVRAVVVHDEALARLSRQHNDANVACFGERVQKGEDILRLAKLWLEVPFEGGRHATRVDKIRRLESPGDAPRH